MQISHGIVKSPELLHPDEDVDRITAAAIYSKQLSNNSMINATAALSINKVEDHDGENAIVVKGE